MSGRLLRGLRAAGLAVAVAVGTSACLLPAATPKRDALEELRSRAAGSTEAEVLGRWLLGELTLPGGDAARAKKARSALEAQGARAKASLQAAFALALDDDLHGRLQAAATGYLEALVAARGSGSPDAPLFGWYAANRVVELRGSVSGLWQKQEATVKDLLERPGSIGWRARTKLLDWWANTSLRAELGKPGVDPGDLYAAKLGCLVHGRLAGPFGRGTISDAWRSFDAEAPGPWPSTFAKDPTRALPPEIRVVERTGCTLRAKEPRAGIHYVESFVDLPDDADVIVVVQAAQSIRVDDMEVLSRDPREWGSWPRYGAHLRLAKGRHRILGRVVGTETAIYLLGTDGRPLGVPGSTDPAPPYALVPPKILPSVNVLEPFLLALGVPAPKGHPAPLPRDTEDGVARFVAASLAYVEGQGDVASVLLEPLVKEQGKAAAASLALQATVLDHDPIFTESDAADLARDLNAKAAAKDDGQLAPRAWIVLDSIRQVGVGEAAKTLRALADRFPEVPQLLESLAELYLRVGYKVERAEVITQAAARFPENVELLALLEELHDERGDHAAADAVALRIQKLEPESEIELTRALNRQDYKAAIAELERLGKARPDRKDIALRIADLLVRSGKSGESLEKLERALARDPTSAGARLALADARFAAGDRGSLRKALVEAIRTGSDQGSLREAIELLDGVTDLEPYRQDSRKVIADYERAKVTLPGNAARVLDYGALHVRPDGSARMLEHEIIRIQSREAIQEHAEQRVPPGIVLHLRVIKKDGRVLEPEAVSGKPTVTMPHLDEGDYIETESIYSLRSDGSGRRFEGPRWLFREEKVSYFRSEYVVVSPETRPLDVETIGDVPAPTITRSGGLVTRRWRVDRSPALPEEPASAPVAEFLPNVRVGWGITQEDTLRRLADAAIDHVPRDPRVRRIAEGIAQKGKPWEKARRLYRWVLDNVQPARESDPRRSITSRQGSRLEAFLYLARLSGISADLGLVEDRLAPPPHGPLSASESFTSLAVRVSADGERRWMTVREEHAPFGFLPSPLRGQPAVVLVDGLPRERTQEDGDADVVKNEGTVRLELDGSATLDLVRTYHGRDAIVIRKALEAVPEARLKDTIQVGILAPALPGAKLTALDIKHLGDLDAPLVLDMKARVPNFAVARDAELIVPPPFALRLGGIAALPKRETPIYVSEAASVHSVVKLRVELPKGAALATRLAPSSFTNGARTVSVKDRFEAGALVIEREFRFPAGRIPASDYDDFRVFARSVDQAMLRDVTLTITR